MHSLEVETRFLLKVVPNLYTGCWEWTGCITQGTGYGKANVNGRAIAAHRLSYELFRGAIPEGLVLDHLCRNRTCVNPDHLEPVTQKENVNRGLGATKAACSKGHRYDEVGSYKTKRGRVCKRCHIENVSNTRRRRKERLDQVAGR